MPLRTMIELHRPAVSPAADAIEETLRDLCVAYRVAASTSLFLEEGGRRFSGDAVRPYLDALSDELRANREVSGDACYVDPRSGKVC